MTVHGSASKGKCGYMIDSGLSGVWNCKRCMRRLHTPESTFAEAWECKPYNVQSNGLCWGLCGVTVRSRILHCPEWDRMHKRKLLFHVEQRQLGGYLALAILAILIGIEAAT
eukprot:1137554-Pelagomonas_calceolata.AAC.5